MKIRRAFRLLAALVMICTMVAHSVSAAEPEMSAQAMVVMDCATGRIVRAMNENERLSMASTTKIMTALLAIECCPLDRAVTITEEMVRVEGSSMGLRAGDIITVDGLVHGALLASGNDAANAIALTVSDSIEQFAALMNERARALGAEQTCFVTPSGLDAQEHYTTAADLARIARAAMSNETFAEIAGKVSEVVSFGNPAGEHTLKNHNRLLTECEGVIGVKTGYTKKSGRCLVTCAKRNDVQLIVVTLNDPNDWTDHRELLDWAFSEYSAVALSQEETYSLPVVGSPQEHISVAALGRLETVANEAERAKITTEAELPRFLYAPVRSGDTVGRVVFRLDGEIIGELPLLACQSAPETEDKSVWKYISDFFSVFWQAIRNIF